MQTTLSLNINKNRFSLTYIGKVGHDGILVIGRQVVVAGDRGNWGEGGKVVAAILVVGCCPRDVWVVGFRDLARGLGWEWA